MGTAQLGLRYGIKGNARPALEESMRILKTAADMGVDMLDTASAYGEAEQVIGRFFAQYPPYKNKFSVVTKLPSFNAVPAGAYFETALSIIENSLKDLSSHAVNGLLLHNEQDILNNEVKDALITIKQKGLAQNIGVSIYDPFMALCAANDEAIDYIQVPYNVLDRRLEGNGFFMRARKNKKTIFARSAFLQGLLVMDKTPIPHAAPYVRAFHAICRRHGLTPSQGCLQYAAANDAIDYLIMGVENADEVIENFAALKRRPSPGFIEEIRENIICTDESILVPSLWRKEDSI